MRIIYSVWKEWLLLSRDRAGLAVLYIMPLLLIVLMALIQDAPFRDYKEAQIPVAFIDQDGRQLSGLITGKLSQTGTFAVSVFSGKEYDREKVVELVKAGKYKAAVIIQKDTDRRFKNSLRNRVEIAFSGISPLKQQVKTEGGLIEGVEVVWEPVIKKSFKDGVLIALGAVLSDYQADLTVKLVAEKLQKLSEDNTFPLETSPVFSIRSSDAAPVNEALYGLNSVQHNVPAWTVFGIFFIVLPLAGNLIRERDQKTMLRLHLIPGAIFINLLSKVLAYLLVACSQFILILAAGIYLMPLLGLPALQLGQSYTALVAIIVTLGLAASAYGIFTGTVFRSYSQASSFGSISVVILAAVGGIWVPVFVMPKLLQTLSLFSPLGWGMNAFNAVFLKGSGIKEISRELFYLFSFSGLMLVLSFILEKNRKTDS